MFGKIIPGISELPHNFVYYSIFLVALFIVLNIVLWGNFKKIDSTASWLFVFGIYMVATLWLKGLTTGYMQEMGSRVTGVVLGTLMLTLIYQSRAIELKRKFFDRLFIMISVVFVFQTVISAYESANGTLLGDYEIPIYFSFDERDLFFVEGASITDLLGFSIPFTGMLGTHNTFGNMLMYYNLIFLSQFLFFRRKFYAALLALVVLATLGNTTRVALFLIVLCDMAAVFYFSKSKLIRRGLVFITALSGIWAISEFYVPFTLYLDQASSLFFRGDLWLYALRYVFESAASDPLSIFLGLDIETIFKFNYGFHGTRIASFENQFLAIFVYTGVIGLGLFFYVFFWFILKYSKHLPKEPRTIFLLLGATILLSSITLDVNLHYSSYVLIVLLYLYLITLEVKAPEPMTNSVSMRNPQPGAR